MLGAWWCCLLAVLLHAVSLSSFTATLLLLHCHSPPSPSTATLLPPPSLPLSSSSTATLPLLYCHSRPPPLPLSSTPPSLTTYVSLRVVCLRGHQLKMKRQQVENLRSVAGGAAASRGIGRRARPARQSAAAKAKREFKAQQVDSAASSRSMRGSKRRGAPAPPPPSS